VQLGKRVHRVAWNGVVGGMAVSTCQMFAAALGWLPPRASALMQELVDLSALVHSLQVRWTSGIVA